MSSIISNSSSITSSSTMSHITLNDILFDGGVSEVYGRYLQYECNILISHIRYVRSINKTKQLLNNNSNNDLYNAYKRIYIEFLTNNIQYQPIDVAYIYDNNIHSIINSVDNIQQISDILYTIQNNILQQLTQYIDNFIQSDYCRDVSLYSELYHGKRYDSILQHAKSLYMEEFIMYNVEFDQWNLQRTQYNIIHNIVDNNIQQPTQPQRQITTSDQHITSNDNTDMDDSSLDPYITHMLLTAKQLFLQYIRCKSEYWLELPEQYSENVVQGWNLARRTHKIEYKLIDSLLHVQQYAINKIKTDIWPTYFNTISKQRLHRYSIISNSTPLLSATVQPHPQLQRIQSNTSVASTSTTSNPYTIQSLTNKPRIINTPKHSIHVVNNNNINNNAVTVETPSLTPLIVSTTPLHNTVLDNNIQADSPLYPIRQISNTTRNTSNNSNNSVATGQLVPRRHSLDDSDLKRLSDMRLLINNNNNNNNSNTGDNSDNTTPIHSLSTTTSQQQQRWHRTNNGTPMFQSIVTPRSSISTSILNSNNNIEPTNIYKIHRNISNGLNSDLHNNVRSESDEDISPTLTTFTLNNNNDNNINNNDNILLDRPLLKRTLSDTHQSLHNNTVRVSNADTTYNTNMIDNTNNIQQQSNQQQDTTDQFEHYAYSVLSGQIALQRNLCKYYAADDIDVLYYEKGGNFGSRHKQHNLHMTHSYINTLDPFKVILQLRRRVVQQNINNNNNSTSNHVKPNLSIDIASTHNPHMMRQLSADTPTARINDNLPADADLSTTSIVDSSKELDPNDSDDELVPHTRHESFFINNHNNQNKNSKSHRRSVRFSFDSNTVVNNNNQQQSSTTQQSSPRIYSNSNSTTSPIRRSSLKQTTKSILRPETIREVFDRVTHERENEAKQYISQLRTGCVLRKLNEHGKAEKRYFWVSEDGSELQWTKVDKHNKKVTGLFRKTKKINLIDCVRIRYGATTAKRFGRYNNDLHEPW